MIFTFAHLVKVYPTDAFIIAYQGFILSSTWRTTLAFLMLLWSMAIEVKAVGNGISHSEEFWNMNCTITIWRYQKFRAFLSILGGQASCDNLLWLSTLWICIKKNLSIWFFSLVGFAFLSIATKEIIYSNTL